MASAEKKPKNWEISRKYEENHLWLLFFNDLLVIIGGFQEPGKIEPVKQI